MGYGNRISILLKEHNMSVAELSRKTGIRPTTLYSIIDNDSLDIKISVARKISEVFNISLSDFAGFEVGDNMTNLLQYLPDSKIDRSDNKNRIFLFNIKELQPYFSLNSKGRKKALSYINDLSKLPEYTENDSPTTE